MRIPNYDIELISCPSILGLRPSGVEFLAESLLANDLPEKVRSKNTVIHVPTFNAYYSAERDKVSNCLNAHLIKDLSLNLSKTIQQTLSNNRFALVLGGDCSIILGIMLGLKIKGIYGLIFLDAHADFYEPEKSISGEVADMDLAIVTGRGPELLTDINNLHPYVREEHVIHIGQRDWEETQKYGSQDIRQTAINCFDFAEINKKGIDAVITEALQHMCSLDVEGYWIHYDTDVLSDDINPAVDYRLPGGLGFEQVEKLIKSFLSAGKVVGMSVSIFNPRLDNDGHISKYLSESIGRSLSF